MGLELLREGNVVSFDVHPTILGTQFKKVKIMSRLDADTTRFFNFDPISMHANVYPTLPAGTVPDDAYKYYYLKLQLPNGTITIVGIPWIKADTIRLETSSKITIEVEDVTPDDLPIIVEALAANGYQAAKVNIS